MNIIKKISLIFLTVFLFVVPFDFPIFNIFLFVFIVGVLINKDFYKKIKENAFARQECIFFIVSLLYVIWCCISLLWSENYIRGLELIGRYTLLIIFPLFLILAKVGGIIKRLDCLFWCFVCGVFVSSFFCLVWSYQDCWHETSDGEIFYFDTYNRDISFWESTSGGFSYFSYDQLSHFINPAYYSLYFSMVVLFFLERLKTEKKYILKLLLIIGIIYSSVFVYLLQNRGNMVALISIFILYVILSLKKRVALFFCVGIIVFGLFGAVHNNGRLSVFSNVMNIVSTEDSQEMYQKLEETNDRIIIWRNALQVIKENPILGVGIGDTDTELEKQYQKNNLDFEYGTHNQYIYAQLSMGIVGLFLLLAMLLVPFYYGIKNRYFPLIGFSVAVMINLLFENMLTRNAGLMFIPWAMMVLLMMSEEKKKVSEK